MSETAKRLERAEKHLQKGKLSSALEEFRLVLTEDPSNDFIRQRAADLCISLDLGSEAAGYLSELYDRFAGQNRAAEAVSTYKKLARLGPVNTDRTFKYAQFILKSSPREAITVLNGVFEEFRKSKDKQQAVNCLRMIVELEPSLENFRRAAELSEENGDKVAAALHYLQIGKMEENSGRDGSEYLEKAYALDPQNTTAALAHARALLRASHPDKAVEILQVLTLNTPDYLDTYANALLMSRRIDAAESVVMKYFTQTPKAMPMIGEVLSAYLSSGRTQHAIDYARSLEPKMKARQLTRDFLNMIRELVERHSSSTELLEYLAQVYNSSNREGDYCATLLRLFELYFAQRSFGKAADCLERATDVDAYEPGHAERLEMLRGKIDGNRFNSIASRLMSVGTTTAMSPIASASETAVEPEPVEKAQEPTVLEDLMLQAEIFLQYSMRSKAVERLERINKLFPREEEKREKLAQIFASAGFVPKYDDLPPVKAPAAATAVADENAVDNFAKVTEITRNISRQSSVKSVLFATVNDVGRHWNVSRCVAGLSAPGKAPSAAMEYCAPGVPKSDVMGLARLISTLQALAVKSGPVMFEKAQQAPDLQSIKQVLTNQKIESFMAVPLLDGEDHLGLIILEQCTPRSFAKVDQVVLSTIAEQVVLAVNNARLRSLVKTLAPTDEKSGLLRRSSYLDVLLSEVQRSLPQKSPVTLALMNFGSASALVKEVGEANVESAMQEIGHAVSAGIRQNDIAVRYSLTTIALILADTADKNAFFVLDKLRKSTSTLHIPGRSEPVSLTAGIAELVMQPKYEPVDIVTEAINRVELALEIARHEGGNKAHSLAPMYETTAVSA